MPNQTLTIILGGGRGSRLYPLTKARSKPAVPLAGKYRLIDIPISNSLNSGLRHIYVLTQFESASLNRHIGRTYRFDNFSSAFVEILAAEQTDRNANWYQGTADAVRQHWHRFRRSPTRHALILSGDQLYRMDYRKMLRRHKEGGYQATVAVQPVTREQAMGFGILRLNDAGDIIEFVEKPKDPAVLDSLAADPEVLRRLGFEDPERRYMASMGIYIFDRDFMDRVFEQEGMLDFGQHVLPFGLKTAKVGAYVFNDYWEDIGTMKAFYRANLELGKLIPNFRFYDPKAPIYTRSRPLPASKIYNGTITDSIIAEGSILRTCVVSESVIGIRARVGEGAEIHRTVMMGADWFESQEEREDNIKKGIPDVGVGNGAYIQDAIIDKNARIGEGVRIINKEGLEHFDGENYFVRDGLVIIPKNAVVLPGTVI